VIYVPFIYTIETGLVSSVGGNEQSFCKHSHGEEHIGIVGVVEVGSL
jgi:hypothetical protein